MTARQIVDTIKAKIGVPWDEKSYRDTFKMGDPDTSVKGVAATFMATLDVIQRANHAGLNFVIEVSTNLVNWRPLQTNLSPFTFVDTNEPASPFRFYRAVLAH